MAAHLADRFEVPWISIWEAVQSATRAGSELGDKLRRFMDAEQPPPDELIAALVVRRLGEPDTASGFVFSASDAKVLPLMLRSLEPLEIQVVELALADGQATGRLTGRRMCRDCGKVWHIESAPTLDADICDRCGGGLIQRQDDAPAAVARQLSVYHERSSPVLARYREAGRLISVDAARLAQEIAADLTDRIDQPS